MQNTEQKNNENVKKQEFRNRMKHYDYLERELKNVGIHKLISASMDINKKEAKVIKELLKDMIRKLEDDPTIYAYGSLFKCVWRGYTLAGKGDFDTLYQVLSFYTEYDLDKHELIYTYADLLLDMKYIVSTCVERLFAVNDYSGYQMAKRKLENYYGFIFDDTQKEVKKDDDKEKEMMPPPSVGVKKRNDCGI